MVHRIWTLSTKPRMSSIAPSTIIGVSPSVVFFIRGYWLGCEALHSVTFGSNHTNTIRPISPRIVRSSRQNYRCSGIYPGESWLNTRGAPEGRRQPVTCMA